MALKSEMKLKTCWRINEAKKSEASVNDVKTVYGWPSHGKYRQ
jgi:hypothetical protein